MAKSCEPKRQASDKQIAANRANSKKSTGPKSATGKFHSRRNSLKHGMCSKGDILPGELDRKVKESLAKWSDQLRPEGEVEIKMVVQAVNCSAKLEWLDGHFNAVVGKQSRESGERFDARERRATLLEAATLATDPVGTLKTLKLSAPGYTWLLDEWQTLLDSIPAGWDDQQSQHALHLLGIDTTPPLTEGGSIRQLIAACRRTVPIEEDGQERELDEVDAARHVLQSLIRDTMSNLIQVRDERFVETYDLLRREAQAASMIPLGKTGSLWPRYQGINAKGFHQAIHDLIKIRKLDDPQRPNDFRRPTKGGPNEPNDPPQRPYSHGPSDDLASAFAEAEEACEAKDTEIRRLESVVAQLKMKLEFEQTVIRGMEKRFENECRRNSELLKQAVEEPSTPMRKGLSIKSPSVIHQVFQAAAVLIALWLGARALKFGGVPQGEAKQGRGTPAILVPNSGMSNSKIKTRNSNAHGSKFSDVQISLGKSALPPSDEAGRSSARTPSPQAPG